MMNHTDEILPEKCFTRIELPSLSFTKGQGKISYPLPDCGINHFKW